nr:phosphoribosylamine--glycine ligase [Devriesea agamarum]
MSILVIGSGGREHAIVRAFARENPTPDIHVAPGNPGMSDPSTCHGQTVTRHNVSVNDRNGLIALARELQPGLIVIGPEAPLVAGIADDLRADGHPVFGPSAAAARLEGSKSFAKEVMRSAGVPTASAVVCTALDEVDAGLDTVNPPGEQSADRATSPDLVADPGAGQDPHLDTVPYTAAIPYVVKADGLAAGKGVVVTPNRDEALAHARTCLAEPGSSVLLEEFLDGPELSLFCICDGEDVIPLAPAQDFKRAFTNNEGPNTGGMGAYSPLPWAPSELVDEVVERVARPTLRDMVRRGTPFSGLLFIGLALTSRGVRVVEFNVRFGDPETQVVLERLRTPLSSVLLAAATGTLDRVGPLEWSEDAAVAVVLAADGYPGTPRTGDPITGLDRVPATGAHVLHAGTSCHQDGQLISAGGRVLCTVGTGVDLASARKVAYAGLREVSLPGAHFRTDIALAASQVASRPGSRSAASEDGES